MTSKLLDPQYRKVRPINQDLTGQRTRHTITLNPNKVNPNEELYIDIPKLSASNCLVPGSFHLLFDFKNKNTKSWFRQNLSKGLVARLQVKMGGESVYDNTHESMYEIYKDLWLSARARSEMTEVGVANENTRKLISKDDTGASAGDVAKISDALAYKIYGTKQKLALDKILGDHGLYNPHSMKNDIQYILNIAPAADVMVAQGGEAVGGFSLENLEAEHEVVDNADTASLIASAYAQGKSLAYEHVTHFKTTEWSKDTTIVNETVNLPRQSMKAIVMLFRAKPKSADSEDFVYPNITGVKVTIEGVPNQVYSQGIPKSRFYDEAKRLFSQHYVDQFATLKSFYKNHFALVVDLKSIADENVYGAGKKLMSTQSGILLEITKDATTANVARDTFIVSDGLLQIVDNTLNRVQY